MNISYTLRGICFEWDSRKASSNLQKHRIRFESACEVFFDPFLKVADEADLGGEYREAVVGLTMNWRLLYVVYVERKDVLRLISARKVTNSERMNYENR